MMAEASLWRFFMRPSLFLGLISVIAYWDDTALNGEFVYDDGGSIKNNVVVNGKVPLKELWTRDFWGTPMTDETSHKSFRPITTLSFRLNWMWAENEDGTVVDTFGFHLVNVILHGVVTVLATEAASVVLEKSVIPTVIAGALFGLHPLHVEAVTNITSRGELLMSFFSLLAFLVYVHSKSILGMYVIPWLFMILSVLCKEQGATALMTIALYDFVSSHESIVQWLRQCASRHPPALQFLKRAAILGFQTIAVVLCRYWLNGPTKPDFTFDQNPAGFSQNRFTRAFSISWVHVLYLVDAVVPTRLCPDWSGRSIDLIESLADFRISPVLILWAVFAAAMYSLVVGTTQKRHQSMRRVFLLGFLAFMFVPFLLSSNLLVVVGLMKADRVVYQPLLGFCILQAHLFQFLFFLKPSKMVKVIGYLLLMAQLALFSAKLHERNLAWSNSLDLWLSAYQVNNRSTHTMYNCGYELSIKQRYKEAEQVLRPIGNARTEGPSNTFVYAMVLYNLDRCNEAKPLIEDALAVVEEKRAVGGVRDSESSLNRVKSNLLVSKAYCTNDMAGAGKLFYEAVQVDQTNQYAVDQAMMMMKKVEAVQAGLNPHLR